VRTSLVALLAPAVAGASPVPTASKGHGPFLLAGLPSLGTVSRWCDGQPGSYALGFRVFRGSADTGVRLRAGGVTRQVSAHPGHLVRFPFSRARLQRLFLVQATEPRSLRARVTVYFAPKYGCCEDYFVPRVDIAVRTQFNY
jgi:hypothetical protein